MQGEKKELSINTVPVEIRVLTVDGKRMTKSVFDQIIYDRYALDIIDVDGDNWSLLVGVLGWVKGRQDNWLLYHRDGVLIKSTWGNVRDGVYNVVAKRKLTVDQTVALRGRITEYLFSKKMQVFISI